MLPCMKERVINVTSFTLPDNGREFDYFWTSTEYDCYFCHS